MKYHLHKGIMHDDVMRNSFNMLAERIFGLNFENWYQEGFWTEGYVPYTLFQGEEAIANISVNPMEVFCQGKVQKGVQLGTVMTDAAYRNQGLSRRLMKEVKKDWEDQCDFMFLFANKSVLGFYPKFGFEKGKQYQFSIHIHGIPKTSRKLDMDTAQDRELLRKQYEKKNPFSKLQVIHNYELLMFYCTSVMREFIYYVPEHDAVVIAECHGEVMNCFDIFCDEGRNMLDILGAVASQETNMAILAFTPKDSIGFDVRLMDDNHDTLFLLEGKQNIFSEEQLLFPEIAHT